MATTRTELSPTYQWTKIADDVTALILVQVESSLHTEPAVDLLVAASLPDVGDPGVAFWDGDTLIESTLPALGASGALYAYLRTRRALVTVVT